MDCREEVAILERRLKPLPGLEDLSADLVGQRLRVRYDAAKLSTTAIVEAVAQTGMRAWLEHEEPVGHTAAATARQALVVVSGAALAAGLLLEFFDAPTRARAWLLSAVDSDGRHLHGPPRLGRDARDVARHQRADAGRGRRRDRDRRVVRGRDGDVSVCVCADSRGPQHGSRAERDSRADGSDAARGGGAPRRPGDAGRRRRSARRARFCW